MHSNKWQKIILIVSLCSLFVIFNQCVVKEFDSTVTRKIASEQTNSVVKDTPQEVVPTPTSEENTGSTEVAVTVISTGIKNFDQINQTFSTLTGINPANDNNITNTFNKITSQLPSSNDIKSYSSSQQVAIIKLAGEYCNSLFENATYYNKIYPNFNVNQATTIVFSATNKPTVIATMIDAFWGSGTQEQSVIDDATAASSQLISDVLAEETSTNATVSRKALKAVCTSLLSSIQVIHL